MIAKQAFSNCKPGRNASGSNQTLDFWCKFQSSVLRKLSLNIGVLRMLCFQTHVKHSQRQIF
jgi:hypothetical protein